MRFTQLILAPLILAPFVARAALSGDYVSQDPEQSTKMHIEALGGGTFRVHIRKDDNTSTCDRTFDLEQNDANPNKLFAQVRQCYVTVLAERDWASITANGDCDRMCDDGTLDTQGLKHQ